MKKALMVPLALTAFATHSWAACNELYFSEYIEGSSFNKAIEIYNPTASAISLAGYSLELFNNGNTTPNTILNLSGAIASGDVFVVAHSSANNAIQSQADITSGVANFNGDDALVLKHNSTIIDSFGRVGEDPGSQWSGNGVGTQDATLIRFASITSGDTNPNDNFDPSLEWTELPQDTFSELGRHTSECTNGTGGSSDIGGNNTATTTLISAIQGSGTISPLLGQNATIEAIVVGDFQPTLSGFFVQEENADTDANAATSEGLFIFCPTCSDVNIGDHVKVTGVVGESFENTQLQSISALTVISQGNALPTAKIVTLPVADTTAFEAAENMLVTIKAQTGALSVTETFNLGRFGEFGITAGRPAQFTHDNAPSVSGFQNHLQELAKSTLLVDDGRTDQNPDPIIHPDGELTAFNTLRSGYTINEITGCLNFSFGEYRIQPTSLLSFNTATNPRTTAPNDVLGTTGNLKVASFNVLNYFNTFNGCTGGVNGGTLNCRGANNSTEFTRQRDKIFAAMSAIDADIFGLMEIENDGYGSNSALRDLVDGLNAVVGSGTYSFINADTLSGNTDALGNDAIKVALIYKSATVTPVGNTVAAELDTVAKNRPTLIQTFEHIASGERLTVSVNHLKSKGSSCDSIGDPDTGDGQGNCNLTRTDAARVLMNVITNEFANEANILVIGDLNAYAQEDPITVIKNAGFSDLNLALHGTSPYSFIFDGQLGYLDHALASEALLSKVTGITDWHINTDEPRSLDYNTEFKSTNQINSLYNPDPFRASDHDPMVVGFAFEAVNNGGGNTGGACGELLISEYVEGSSFNKAIELFNPTSQTINLADYTLEKDTNGNNNFASVLNLNGSIAPGDVFIIVHSSATSSLRNLADQSQNGGAMNFNGDDQVRLSKNGNEIDHIGIRGDINFGRNRTFVRNANVTVPTAGEQDPRNNGEWDTFSRDTFQNLGRHIINSCN